MTSNRCFEDACLPGQRGCFWAIFAPNGSVQWGKADDEALGAVPLSNRQSRILWRCKRTAPSSVHSLVQGDLSGFLIIFWFCNMQEWELPLRQHAGN